ncbi:MAG: 2-oxoacid:acceptor oxidoreductase family protein [Candidatus Bathyarchaeia archaeon]
MPIEIRLHGRGGQGVVLAAYIISIAGFYDGMFSRSFATFGVERRGSPVESYVMMGDKNEMTRSKVYNPDHIVVMDPHLVKFIKGTNANKELVTITANTIRPPQEILNNIGAGFKTIKVGVIDATSTALEALGRPITNTVMLGAFTKVAEVISLESLLRAIESQFKGDLLEKNLKAAELGYNRVKIENFSGS